MICTVEVLRQILEKVPDDFEVAFIDEDILRTVSDKVEIDVSGKMIILKSS